MQLYKLYYKNVNNLLPSYFSSFTLHQLGNGDDEFPNLRHRPPRLPLAKREYFVQSTRFQYLKLIRDTPQCDLDLSTHRSIYAFIYHFKCRILDEYDPECHISFCYVCMKTNT